MPRRFVHKEALKLDPIRVSDNVWFYEVPTGISLCVDTRNVKSSVDQIHHIPYRKLAETIARAWGVELREKK